MLNRRLQTNPSLHPPSSRLLISMTGHGQASIELPTGRVFVEIRSVNNRFLKISSRLSDAVSSLEAEIEPLVRQRLQRGTVSVSVKATGLVGSGGGQIDVELLANYLSQASRSMQLAGWSGPVGDFLALPGVLKNEADEHEKDSILPPLRKCLKRALDDLYAMRIAEGSAMLAQFQDATKLMRTQLASIELRAPDVLKEYEERIKAKLSTAQEKLGLQFEPIDILRETTLFADRCDIREELVRFSSHLDQLDSLIAAEQSPGRKLEFLIQELHREVNTIGSKSYDAQVASSVIEIKTVIEQLREMVQNVE